MKINLHTHTSSPETNVIEIVNRYPNTNEGNEAPFFSIGIHPWYGELRTLQTDLLALEQQLSTLGCLAVGECGLDKRIERSIEEQKKIVIPQLLLAEHYKKPIILHCVAAYQEIIALQKELKLTVPMILHGFSKNSQVAQSLIAHGFHLSFGKYLLKNPALHSVFAELPEDRFFLETDTLAVPIQQVYDLASTIRNNDVEPIIEQNFKRVFGLHTP